MPAATPAAISASAIANAATVRSLCGDRQKWIAAHRANREQPAARIGAEGAIEDADAQELEHPLLPARGRRRERADHRQQHRHADRHEIVVAEERNAVGVRAPGFRISCAQPCLPASKPSDNAITIRTNRRVRRRLDQHP